MINIKDKKVYSKLILLGMLVALVIAYFILPSFQSKVTEVLTLFSSLNVDIIVGYIRSFGIYAVIVSFLLMALQSIAAPLPAFLITFANAAVFGWWQGAILSWTSAMVGALICFYIARILGRDAVEKLTSKFAMESVDEFFEKYGRNTILICRLLPFVSFDFISYGAGLTSMRVVPFLVATGIGQLPATIVYSYVGGTLTGNTQTIVTGMLIMFAVVALGVMLKKIHNDKKMKADKIVKKEMISEKAAEGDIA